MVTQLARVAVVIALACFGSQGAVAGEASGAVSDKCSSAVLSAYSRRERSEVWNLGSSQIDETLRQAKLRISARVARHGCLRYLISREYSRGLSMYGATYAHEIIVIYRFFPNDEDITPDILSKFEVYYVDPLKPA